MTPTRIRAAVLEDQPATRERLVQVLQTAGQVDVVFECGSGQSMLDWLARHQPDVLLVDLGLPDMPGLNVIEFCHRLYPLTDIMVITMFGDEANMMAAFAQGARGYLLKDGSEQDLARHVHDLHAGGSPMTPVIARQLLARLAPTLHERPPKSALPQPGAVGLSDRELEILSALSRGYTYQEVAGLLDISVHTVQTHVKNTYGKLDVHSRAEAVFEARQLGLL
ncbi:MAG: response regulator transcription factor [Burkholderiaceae bacterium]